MEHSSIKVGDAVWVKYGHWPWWPSRVIQIDEREKKPVIVRFFACDQNSDLGYLEYRQVKPFDSFRETGAKQKGKDIALALRLADNYRKEHVKENVEAWKQPTENFDLNKNDTVIHSESQNMLKLHSEVLPVKPARVLEEIPLNKLKRSNLNKRKPDIKASEKKLIKKVPTQNSIKEIEKIDQPKIQNERQLLIPSSRKSSSTYILKPSSSQETNLTDLSFDSITLSEIVQVADRLAESLSSVRDCPARYQQEDVERLFAKIGAFCAYCRQQSDADLKQLVQLRLGSYLFAMIHLLRDIGQHLSPTFAQTMATLQDFLAMIKQRTFNLFARPFASEEVCSQHDSHDCSTQSVSAFPASHAQPVVRLPSPPAESVLTISQSENIALDNEAFKRDLQTASHHESFISDIQSSTVKQEEPVTEAGIQFKLRKKVCKKIRGILVNDLAMKVTEAERLTLGFEQAIFGAFSENTFDYIQAIKAVCTRVRAKKAPVTVLVEISKTDHTTIRKSILQFSSTS